MMDRKEERREGRREGRWETLPYSEMPFVARLSTL